MKARDIMTREVVSVGPDAPAREVARLLLEHGISAVPVIDRRGALLGMLSEGDLIGRDAADREARRDWWLELLAEGSDLSADFLASLRAPERKARDVMTGPVVTASEDAELDEIARLLTQYHVKRVPVLREGRVTGIVSRADLLRALAEAKVAPPAAAPAAHSALAEALIGLDHRFLHPRAAASPRPAPRAAAPGISAADFQALMADHAQHEQQRRDEQRRAALEERRRAVAALIDEHVSDESWRGLLHGAREAAEQGRKEFMLLRFPSPLCSDGGRAINAADPAWPASLRGEAAELYLRWERDLKPRGFGLVARVLDFPGGKPGDVGLFLVWD